MIRWVRNFLLPGYGFSYTGLVVGGGIRINPLGVCPFGYAKGISLSLMHFYHLGKMHWFPGTPGHGE